MFILVLEIESDGKLEIKLNGTALMRSLEGIEHLNVDLGSVEGSITWVFLPGFAKLVESLSKSALSLIPESIISKLVLRSGGELKLKLEAKDSIDEVKEVKYSQDFSHNVLRSAEDVSIILAESSDSGESRESS